MGIAITRVLKTLVVQTPAKAGFDFGRFLAAPDRADIRPQRSIRRSGPEGHFFQNRPKPMDRP